MNVSFNMLEEMFYRQPVEKVCHWLRQCFLKSATTGIFALAHDKLNAQRSSSPGC
jgi:hypothetical protein